MDFLPHLGELGASFIHLVPIIGAAIALPVLVDREKTLHRVLLLAIAAALALRYAWWRITETVAPFGLTLDWAASWSLLGIEMAALLGSLSAFLILSRHRDRSGEATDNLEWWTARGQRTPKVALLIATYNEELEVLERTIVGARHLRHPEKEVMVLDDGRRDWLRDYCAAQGVTYLRRDDNKGSKAGNINNALRVLKARDCPPDFIAVLDADFVPHRGFLSRSLALFHDDEVGLVQTPQHFFNADPIQHNLGLSRAYPDEQRFFFDHLQSSRDAWGIAICCGTSSIVRFEAVMELGGFPTESITEDFMLTVALQSRGWRTVYLNEPLTEGLAPEGLKEYVTQRARWCLGLMQIARSSVGPLSKAKLRLRDRWSVTDSVLFWLTSFIFRLAAICYPLLYWFGNVTVVNASLPDVISYFGTYYLWIVLVMHMLSRGTLVPILHDVSQLIGAIPISRAAVVGLLKPKGHPFSVTAKGGDRSRIVVQWEMMMPFVILLGLSLLGLMLGIFSDRFAYNDAGDGKLVVLFWTVYNLFVLSITVIACIELPRRERHIGDAPDRAIVSANGALQRVWITSLTRDVARIRGRRYPNGTAGRIRIREVGDVDFVAVDETVDGARLQLFPSPAQRDALFVKFYTEDNMPGVANVRLEALASGLARRLSFSNDP